MFSQPTRFPYRGKLYQIDEQYVLPNRHVVLSNGTILVVSYWSGRIPRELADVRRAGVPGMAVQDIAMQLQGVIAEEIQLAPGESLLPMAAIHFEGNYYAVPEEKVWNSFIELPNRQLLRARTNLPGFPTRVTSVDVLDRSQEMARETFAAQNIVRARLMPSSYTGMPEEPRDLRIRFAYQGEDYILSHEAYEQGKYILFLPGLGYFEVSRYLETSPVQIDELIPISSFQGEMNDAAVALLEADAVDAEYLA